MAAGDAIVMEAYTSSTSYDFQPSSGVEWCITSVWSTSTWYVKSVTDNNIAYNIANNNLTVHNLSSKVFVASGSNQQLRITANNYWQTIKISGVVTKE